MSQQTVNPYPDLGQQYAAGLNAIIKGLPKAPTISDLVTQVYNYFISVNFTGGNKPTIQVTEELNSIAYTATNSYINGLVSSGKSTLSPRTMGFVNMLIGPKVMQNVRLFI